ncbi:hypothetical protein SFUMM280S_01409 [Streptomyces fumanus]
MPDPARITGIEGDQDLGAAQGEEHTAGHRLVRRRDQTGIGAQQDRRGGVHSSSGTRATASPHSLIRAIASGTPGSSVRGMPMERAAGCASTGSSGTVSDRSPAGPAGDGRAPHRSDGRGSPSGCRASNSRSRPSAGPVPSARAGTTVPASASRRTPWAEAATGRPRASARATAYGPASGAVSRGACSGARAARRAARAAGATGTPSTTGRPARYSAATTTRRSGSRAGSRPAACGVRPAAHRRAAGAGQDDREHPAAGLQDP